MKAVRLFEHGDPSVLKYIDVDMPELGEEDVLIKVHATSLNDWDIRYRSGQLPPTIPGRGGFPLPFQLGRDAAGEIVEVGKKVTRWKVGDRVAQMAHPACGQCAMCLRDHENLCVNIGLPGHQIFGGYAQYVARSQSAVVRIPDNVSYELAGATMWAYGTPLNVATRRAPVGPGMTVMITGASGGMATASMQVAKLHGAKVIGSTTRIAREEHLRSLGYDHIVDSTDPDAPDQVRALTGGLGVDAVWDCVGGNKIFAFVMRSIRLGGTVALIATEKKDPVIQLPSLSMIFLEPNIVGVRGAKRRDNEICMELLGEGKIAPVIDRSFPLSQAVEAHIYMESQSHVGKVVLIPEH